MSDFAEQAWDEGFSDENEYLEHSMDEAVREYLSSQNDEPVLAQYINFVNRSIKGVRQNGSKYEFIDDLGNPIDEFDFIGDCQFRFVKVMVENKWGFYDSLECRAGDIIYEEVGDLLFDNRGIESPYHVYKNALLPVKKDGLWGFLDTYMMQIIPCEYLDFTSMIFLIYSEERSKWLINQGLFHDNDSSENIRPIVPEF